MVETRKIYVTERDRERLLNLIESLRRSWRDQQQLDLLEHELDRAKIVKGGKIPDNVVTMNSRVRVTDLKTDKEMVYQVVFPRDADADKNMISVLAPIGMAMLGYQVGSEVDWTTPGGVRHWRIEAVEYQPPWRGGGRRTPPHHNESSNTDQLSRSMEKL